MIRFTEPIFVCYSEVAGGGSNKAFIMLHSIFFRCARGSGAELHCWWEHSRQGQVAMDGPSKHYI